MQPRHCAPEIAARWGEAVGAPRWDHATLDDLAVVDPHGARAGAAR